MSILVLVPSRGRPERAAEMFASFRATARLADTRMVIAVDYDDETFPGYMDIILPLSRRRFGWSPDELTVVVLGPGETGDLTRATNGAWRRFSSHAEIIGSVNDDMVFRTHGWDVLVTDALREPGIVYGDDLFQHDALPTSPFMSAAIPRALGWYALPVCSHLFIDNAWADIGRGIERLRYLPDVVIEHVHPLAGKADWDAGYERANNQTTTDHDREAYRSWFPRQRLRDIARVRRALGMEAVA